MDNNATKTAAHILKENGFDMDNYKNDTNLEITIEPIEDTDELTSSANVNDVELIASSSLPKKYLPYFLQVKKAFSGLGVSLSTVEPPIRIPGQNAFALIIKKRKKDLSEKEAYDLFLEIRKKLKAQKVNTFAWKRNVYMRWPNSDDDSFYDILGYRDGKAYYMMLIDKPVKSEMKN